MLARGEPKGVLIYFNDWGAQVNFLGLELEQKLFFGSVNYTITFWVGFFGALNLSKVNNFFEKFKFPCAGGIKLNFFESIFILEINFLG